MKKISYYLVLISLISSTLQAQTKKEFTTKLGDVIKKSKEQLPYDRNFDAYSQKFPEFVINETKKYLNDSVSDVRFAAINIITDLIRVNKELSIRQAGVYQLINTKTGSLHIAAKYLQQFNKDDFNGATKDTIRACIQSEQKRCDEIIMLAGYLDLYDQIPVLKDFLSNPQNYGAKQRWIMSITLARFGDVDEISDCIEFAKKTGCSMQGVYRIFPDLIYTRQKAVFDYLVSVLQNDNMKTASANPSNSNKIACGYRIMELFPGVVEDYPLKYAAGKQIATNDYKEALKLARQWFIDNPDYKINKDGF